MRIRNIDTFRQAVAKAGADRISAGTPCRGTVLAHIPAINLYLIIPSEGPQDLSGILQAIDMSSQPGISAATTSDKDVITAGTPVWYLDHPFLTYNETSRETLIYPIIGVDNTVPVPHGAIFPPWATVPSPDMDEAYMLANDPVISGLLGTVGIARPGDRGFGRPLDATDTDWIVATPFKGFIKASGDHVAMAASPTCGISFFTLQDAAIFNTGSTYIQDAPWGRITSYPDNNKGFTLFKGFAASTANALGGYGEVADILTDNGKAYTLQSDDALPIWAITEIAGSLVQGKSTTVSVPKKDSGVNTGGLDDQQCPATIVHQGYDGNFRIGARHGIALARDPGIDMLRQIQEEAGEVPEPSKEPPMEDPTSEAGGNIEEYASQYAGLMYELMRQRFVERYYKKRDDAYWAADTAKEICEKVFNCENDPPLKELDEEEPAYKATENQIEVDDPVVEGKKLKASARGSYIYQSPTGAIVLSDGHGAEIRMEGGNITITAPGDIKVLPGRDMAILAPRNASVISQGRMELISDKKDVVIKGEVCASLTAVKGMATVESLGTTPSELTNMDGRKDMQQGGGVVIRSSTTAAVVGKDIRIGVQSPSDKSTDGREDHSGNIVIDANKGTALLYGEHAHVTGKRTSSIANADGAGLITTGAASSVFGSVINNVCRQMAMGGSGASSLKVVYPSISPSGIQAEEASGVGSANAVINLKGDMVVSGGVATNRFAAGTAGINTLGCTNGSDLSGIKMNRSVNPSWNQAKGIEGSDVTSALRQVFSSLDRHAADKLFAAAGSKAGGVYYLSTDDYKCSRHFWVLARWQRLLKKGGGGSTWQPNKTRDPLDTEEMCFYPGKEAWDSKGDFVRTIDVTDSDSKLAETSAGTLSNAHIVNAKVE